MTHIPGPWIREGAKIKAISHGKTFTIGQANGRNILNEANEANARLIAAAPELLAALRLAKNAIDAALPWLHPDGYRKNALEVEDPHAYCGEIYEDITAAIAAATGEEVQG
jgi:hypothetical protein